MPSKTEEKTSRILKKKSMFDEPLILETLARLNLSPVHAKSLWRHLTQTDVSDVTLIPQLPKRFVEELVRDYMLTTSVVVKETLAKDGSTTKLLVELQDGLRVESVIMRYGHVQLDCFPETERAKQETREDGSQKFGCGKRATLCVSSQVGCAMGCTFCATGTMGLMANLTSGEILEQLYHAQKIEKIRGIVFMGMGEPLDNYPNVITAIRAMTDSARFSLGASRISISTVGVVPRILSLIRDAPEVGFALSLHAPNQELRVQIVPTAKAWHITKIMDAVTRLVDVQNASKTTRNRMRRILIEYVLISEINDTNEIAHELGVLLEGKSVLLNLIPYNPTAVKYAYKTPTREAQQSFVDIVRGYGVFTVLRQTMGADVDAACGQLVIKQSGIETLAAKDSTFNKVMTEEDLNCGVGDLEDIVKRGSVVRPMLGKVKYASEIKRKKEELAMADVDSEDEQVVVRSGAILSVEKQYGGLDRVFVAVGVMLLVCLLVYRNM